MVDFATTDAEKAISVTPTLGFTSMDVELLLLGGISASPVLGFADMKHWPIDDILGHLEVEAVLGGSFVGAYIFTAGVSATPTLSVTWDVQTIPDSDPDGRQSELGYRPSMPLIVRSVYVEALADIATAEVVVDEHFIMSPTYIPTPADGLYEHGARPGYIGTYRVVGGNTYYRFREPLNKEVVWLVTSSSGDLTDGGLYRFDTNGRDVWLVYKSLPQRLLQQLEVFETQDPDKVYDYWAKLLGAAFSQLMLDNDALRSFFDADYCPTHLLVYLAKQLGVLTFPLDESETMKRHRLRVAPLLHRMTGQEAIVPPRVRIMQYDAYIEEVWVNPDHVDNWDEYDDAPVAIKVDISARGLTEDDIDPNSGEKGQAWIVMPHGYQRYAPGSIPSFGIGLASLESEELYGLSLDDLFALLLGSTAINSFWPSSRVVVHLNHRDGSSFPSSLSGQTAEDIKQRVAKVLRRECLPAHVTIRLFATDEEIGDDGVSVSDTFTLTEV